MMSGYLGREAVAQESPAGGGLDVDDDKGQPDDQLDGADGGARVHELDRGQHRRGSRRPQRLDRLAAGRVGLVHGGLAVLS